MTLRILTSQEIEIDFNFKVMNFNITFTSYWKCLESCKKNHYPMDNAIHLSYNRAHLFRVKVTFHLLRVHIRGVIAFMPFFGSWKNYYPVDCAIHLSHNRPLLFIQSNILYCIHFSSKCQTQLARRSRKLSKCYSMNLELVCIIIVWLYVLLIAGTT